MGISGKYDFEDRVSGHEQSILDKYKVYIGQQLLPLRMDEPRDLIPYYPYLISEEHNNKIRLHTKSHIDEQEESVLTSKLKHVVSYYNQCKRKKVEFNKSEALKKIVLTLYNTAEDCDVELVNRVAENGAKATIDGLHAKFADYMRNQLYELMLNAGWDEDITYKWVYGFDRWLKKINDRRNYDNSEGST